MRRARRDQALWIGVLVFVAIVMNGAMLCFAGASNRYMVDFVPWLTLLAVVGVLSGEQTLVERPIGRRVFRVIWMSALGWTVLFNIFVSFQHNSLLQTNSPAAFERLSAVFNRFSPILDKLMRATYGPIELAVRLPQGRTGKLEPLIIAGQSYKTDYIYTYYTDESHVQIGFEHTSYGGFVTQPVKVDYSKIQNIRVEMGAFYPPSTHPFFGTMSEKEIESRKDFVRIWVNGILYANRRLASFQPVSKDVYVGSSPYSHAFGGRFTGTVEKLSRTFVSPPIKEIGAGDNIQLAVRFPAGRENTTEPIVVTGKTGRGDLLCITYLPNHRVKFTLDHWGYSLAESAPISLDPDQIHLITISLPHLHEAETAAFPVEGVVGNFSVELDQAVVFSGSVRFHPAGAGHVYILENPIGGSTCAPRFTGEILKETVPPITDSPAG